MTDTDASIDKMPSHHIEDQAGEASSSELDSTGRISSPEAVPHGLFITGTDTNVGKTHVACLIIRQLIAAGHRVAAYKPVCSGAIGFVASSSTPPPNHGWRWDDIDRLYEATGGKWTDDLICPQRFLAPLAPPIAAKYEGRSVDSELLITGTYRFSGANVLLIEGAGGWLSPLADELTVADLAQKLKAPVLIVARAGLGTINHTLLTIESIRSRGLVVAGVILNEVTSAGSDQSCQTNGAEIESRGNVRVLGIVPHGTGHELHRHGSTVTIDWRKLTQRIADQGTTSWR